MPVPVANLIRLAMGPNCANWKPETELEVENIDDDVSSHALVSPSDLSRVRVIPAGESWPVREVKNILKDG